KALDNLDDEPEPPDGAPEPPDGNGPPDGGGMPPPSGGTPPEGASARDRTRDGARTGDGAHQPAASGAADTAADAPADDAAASAAPAPAEPTVLPIGATFDPVLLTVDGVGGGAAGRRSPAESDRGRHAGDRRPRGTVRDVALGATLRAAAP